MDWNDFGKGLIRLIGKLLLFNIWGRVFNRGRIGVKRKKKIKSRGKNNKKEVKKI